MVCIPAKPMGEFTFKQAVTETEFEQIHQLNHRVFADEVRQHQHQPDGRLIDRFHHKNHYFIALKADELLGMVAVHDQPPFSISTRLSEEGARQSLRGRPLEVRLLAIDSSARQQQIIHGLLWQVYDFATRHGHSHLVISAISHRLGLYEKIGFRSLGPAVADGAAEFVPMALSLQAPSPTFQRQVEFLRPHFEPVSLLPGPVEVSAAVKSAFARPAISHRSPEFIASFEQSREILCRLTQAHRTALFTGGGTLANDIVAANLRLRFGDRPGIVLSNGEFGERILQQAQQAALKFQTLSESWGHAWNFNRISTALDAGAAWIWAVHHETSTGMLNDIAQLSQLARSAEAKLVLDCVSSVGAVSLDLRDVFLATGVSGKALGAYAGLALVFANEEATRSLPCKALPPSFDLQSALMATGPQSTMPSAQHAALSAALHQHFEDAAAARLRFEHLQQLGSWVRNELQAREIRPIIDETCAAPCIVTFPRPSRDFGARCLARGYRIAHESSYLAKREWMQIATMGHLDQPRLERLFVPL